MSDAQPRGGSTAKREISLHYEMVDGVLQIDISSEGLNDDPNLIALHLDLALDRLRQAGESELSQI